MSTERGLATVVPLYDARARRSRPDDVTVVLSIQVQSQGVVRVLGVRSTLSLAELGHVASVALGVASSPDTPAFFTSSSSSSPLESGILLGHWLRARGDDLVFHWGLWCFDVSVVDIHPRDHATPGRLCIGGVGDFLGRPLDISRVNAHLTGAKHRRRLLNSLCPGARRVVLRAGADGFLPLLQALDLGRNIRLPERVRQRLDALPVERERRAEDAWWLCVLALSSLAGVEERREILVEAFAHSDGERLDAEDITALCARSLEVLRSVGAYGEPVELRPADQRLDMYRYLLRSRSSRGVHSRL